MARTVAGLPEGTRLSDLITLGMLTILIPRSEVRRVLREEGRESQRERQLPVFARRKRPLLGVRVVTN